MAIFNSYVSLPEGKTTNQRKDSAAYPRQNGEKKDVRMFGNAHWRENQAKKNHLLRVGVASPDHWCGDYI